jgi:DNA-directed RNA polymerase subunit omega
MIEPRIDDLLEHVDSRYALVIVAAKRARQINSYHHQLGEGMGFDVAPPPLIESRSKNYRRWRWKRSRRPRSSTPTPACRRRICPARGGR